MIISRFIYAKLIHYHCSLFLGSGKSAFVANWAKRVEDSEPETFMFVHFIGSSADSADYIKLVRR